MREMLLRGLTLLVILFLISSKIYSCEKKKLQPVDGYKKSHTGKIKNRIKKFSEKQLLVITNIANLEQTHKIFLSLFRCQASVESFVKKVVYLGSGRSSNQDNGSRNERGSLSKLDDSLYDGVVVIMDTLGEEVAEELRISYLKSFVEKKKHIFMSINRVIGKKANDLLSELNIQVYGKQGYVNDHFNSILLEGKNKDEREKLNRAFYTSEIIQDTPIVRSNNQEKEKILFKGTAHSVLLKRKYYLDVLTCTKSCLLYDKNNNILKKQKQGKELLLVSSIQMENNFRFIFSSSSDIFSDLFFKINEDNINFTVNIIQWNLKMSGIIRYNNFKIFKNRFKKNTSFFINDFVYMSIDFYELIDDYWVPFKKNDIQFELLKMKIVYRNFLDIYKNVNNPTYYTYFILPNEQGVYTLQIYYLRKGYNILNLEYFIPVRTFLHYDKNKKVPFKNYPFYFYIYLSLLCFFIFTLIILFDNSERKSTHKEKKNN
ncbi:dolichyl-diphosphooligosaccharide--protein glycosyltransferase, putative [Plasmodium ovale wallikeri]|uniref:Dolichyl-diphosphooligosaccharide--protein glycosyltransferase 48 kDa subunit n=1 Tax=Plasmodium ovale wallikeri TaxID=864142 RepID=A0A1A8YPM2_PLAOA|nr:dolichyl-diphosphooligosaccharide--protein glycosyltransferase, putative [Plasmodium ovale wallikeri]SBT33936.1 dolichyl-diphosphooligosaccharide--protein glycosyltransferase, putative [Plasmodium ovale wallikeri]